MFLEKENLIVNRKNGTFDKALFSFIEKLRKEILKEKYSLSVNFISPKEALTLNEKYRNKDYTPNILSFPLSNTEGEIFICLSVARKGAKEFSLSYQDFLKLLLVHGVLHLKGLDHGEKMERKEKEIFKKFVLK
jgi:probable rRNA maturation factor